MSYENIYDQSDVVTVYSCPNPNKIIYAAMHNDYSETGIKWIDIPNEKNAGEVIVKRLLAGNRGHYGCLEHTYILLEMDIRYFVYAEWAALVGVGILQTGEKVLIHLNMRHLLALLEITKNKAKDTKYLPIMDILLDILHDWSEEIFGWYVNQRLTKKYPTAP